MINHTEYKYMLCGTEFQPSIINQVVSQYNSTHGPNPKVPITDWTLKPQITHNIQQCTPPLGQPDIMCTDHDDIDITLFID